MQQNNINLAHPELPYKLDSSDGYTYTINPDFHVVLACLERLQDPDKPELEKVIYLAHHFFDKETPPDMGELFSAFVTGGQDKEAGESDTPEESAEEPLMDFAQDGGVIYASFRQQYGINLLKENMHWYEFQQLLANLSPDTAFGKRVHLRGLDIATLPEGERPKWQRLKDMVAITPAMSAAEQELQKELDRRLAAGEDPTEILKQLKEV